jgi:hypothetical protein
MGAPVRFGFVTGANEHRLAIAGSEACRNWIPERRPDGSLIYIQRPGLAVLELEANTGAWRAGFEQNGRAFCVLGGTLWEITSAGTKIKRSLTDELGNDGLPASMAGNGDQGDQLCIVSNTHGFIFTLSTNTLTAITDAQFPANARQVVYLNGHFIITAKDAQTFGLSAQYDGTSYDANDIGEESKTTDYIQTALVDEDTGELWLIGKRLTEVWRYTGTAGFPLDPVDTIIPIGSAATFGWTMLGGRPYGLGQSKDGDRVFVRFTGYSYERISTHAIEQAIQAYTEDQIAACRAFALEMGGHRFVLFTFVDADATFVYDEATGLWANWDHWDADTLTSHAFHGVGHLFAFGKHIVGSHDDGTIYDLSFAYADDAGDAIRRVGRGPRISAEGKRVPHYGLRIGCETGVGDATTPAPVAMVRWSDDVGRTYSAEQQLPLGAQGNYADMPELRRLGLAGKQGRIYEIVITDPVISAIEDVYLELGGVR